MPRDFESLIRMGLTYNDDGTVLLSAELLLEDAIVSIAEGCRIIARKAFMYQKNMKQIKLPSTLEHIEEYAFSFTSLESFIAPTSLKSIGKKAFYQCTQLDKLMLNSELEFIGSEAFAYTSIRQVRIPENVRFIGSGVFDSTPLARIQNTLGFAIDKNNKFYSRDEYGGLYRSSSSGKIFCEMLFQNIKEHTLDEDTCHIAQKAYTRALALNRVVFPAGVRTIGKKAFFHVRALKAVNLPGQLRSIGENAFRETSLSCLHLPALLEHIGDNALITGANGASTLHNITIDALNPYFYVDGGFLVQRKADSEGHALVFFGQDAIVTVPSSVSSIGFFCIAQEQTFNKLKLHKEIHELNPYAVAPQTRFESIEVELDEPLCGRSCALIPFLEESNFYPDNWVLFPKRVIDVPYLFHKSDEITYMSRYLFERSKTQLGRLQCPQYLSENNKDRFSAALKRRALDICCEFARRGYIEGIELMRSFGFINKDNIKEITAAIQELGDVVITGFMLEMRRACYSSGQLEEEFSL